MLIQRILDSPGRVLEKMAGTKVFARICGNPWLATAVLSAIVLFFSFPPYDALFGNRPLSRPWSFIFIQGEAPFTYHNFGEGSHGSKLAFRFVPAIILNFLNIHSLLPAFIFQLFTMILFYYLMIILFNRLFGDKKKSFIYSLPFCFVMAGHVYCSDVRGIFDTLALDFLLGALLVRDKVFVIPFLLLGYFTDERALIVSTGFFLINAFKQGNFKDIRNLRNSALTKPNIYLFISWFSYLVIRYYLTTVCGLHIGKGGMNLFMSQINKTFFTIYVGLEGFLIPFVLVIYLLLRDRVFAFTALFIMSFFVLLYVAQSVFDIDRSMAYSILILILITLLFDELVPRGKAYKITGWLIIINLLYDVCYPMPAQLYRMKFITHIF
jgi:hypothetical protein